ncbi:MAG: winged helix DNA-binding domain-containing protein [Anaerolineae bacterium]
MALRLQFEQVNRFVMRKQHLATQNRGRDLLALAREIGPVRATPTITPYLSYWARMRGLGRQMLDTALLRRRTLVRVPCMRAKLYVIPTEQYPAYLSVTQGLLRGSLQAFMGELVDSTAEVGMQIELPDLTQRVLEVVSSSGPRTVSELASYLPALNAPVPEYPEVSEAGLSRLGARLIPALCAQGLLVRAHTQGGWRSDQYAYASLSAWLPDLALDVPEEEALRLLVRWYIAAYGPVTTGDISHWLGGIERRQVAATMLALSDELARVQIGDSLGDYVLLREQVDDLMAKPDEEHTACLLPAHDSYPMAYADTRRFLAPWHHERVYDQAGEAAGTVWADGAIVGVWSLKLREERIVARLFESADPEILALVGDEARRLARFLEFAAPETEILALPEGNADVEAWTLVTAHSNAPAPAVPETPNVEES